MRLIRLLTAWHATSNLFLQPGDHLGGGVDLTILIGFLMLDLSFNSWVR